MLSNSFPDDFQKEMNIYSFFFSLIILSRKRNFNFNNLDFEIYYIERNPE